MQISFAHRRLLSNSAAALQRGAKRASLKDQGITLSSTHLGFQVKSIQEIKEFDITLVEMHHTRTGATLLHVDTSDTNNAFGVCFRTPAKESTGVAHILEHIVLCGSERFPVRDPFFKMLKRSMNTFMNAMTAGDFTVYPFSTVIPSDYHNLLQVYLDACFFPLLRKTDFMQEGHRLEVVKDEATGKDRLKRAGVVFNEMKGHLSSSSSLFGVETNMQLYGPDSIYGQVSGGDWKVIPELTHERLVDFHKKKYHPSNALFITYGDLPVLKTMETIDNEVLQRFEYSADNANLPLKLIQQRVAKRNADVAISVPQDSESDFGRKLVRTWLVDEFNCTEVDRVFEASIVSELLLEGASAPVYTNLIESRIAPRFAPGVGFDSSCYYPSFAFGASGVSEDNLDKVEPAILSALETAVKDGFPQQRLDSILHQMELNRRHKRADFGLTCIQAASGTWVHGGSLQSALDFTGPIDRFKTALKQNPNLLQDVANRLVLSKFKSTEGNVRVVATPSATFSVQEPEVPIDSQQQVDEINKLNAELTAEREMTEDLSLLPTLLVSNDVPRTYAEPMPRVDFTAIGQVVRDEKTNGVSYLRGRFPVQKHNQLLPLLCSFIGDVDAGKRTYKELDVALEQYSGTLSVSPSFPTWLKDHTVRPEVFFSLDCLANNAERAYADILGDIFTSSKFVDVNRVSTLLHTKSESMKAGLSNACPRYANSRCMSSFGEIYSVQDSYGGFPQYQYVQQLAQMEDKTKLTQDLQELFAQTFLRPELSLCSDVDVSSSVQSFLNRFLGAAAAPSESASSTKPSPLRASYLALPVPVHYCHAVVQTPVKFGHEDDAAMLVLSRLASYDFLHQQVREKGGAYGSGCSLDNNGFLAFSSFWDPNSVQTLEVFEQCLKWLCEANFTEKQVDEALLSVFASLDAPQNVSGKGMGQFRHGMTQEMKDKQREKLFSLVGTNGVSQLRTVARKHLQNVDTFLQSESAPHVARGLRSSVCIAGKKDTSEEFLKRGFEIVVA